MAINAMRIVWEHYPCGGSKMLVMLALADWCDEDGRSLYPSMTAIARKCRLSKSQAQRIVRSFVKNELLEVVANGAGGKPGETPHYWLHLDRMTGRTDATGSAGATGRTDAREGSHGCGERGRMGATQSTIYPSLTISAELEKKLQAASPSTRPVGKVGHSIPLNDGSEYGIPARQIEEWIAAYPAVDVPQQLRAMRQWSLANPARRKTRRGVLKFANNWLSNEQDKPSHRGNGRADDDQFKGGI